MAQRVPTGAGPPSRLKVIASPPEITLVQKGTVIVRVTDTSDTIKASDRSLHISLVMESGQGSLEPPTLEIPQGNYESRTSFYPATPGDVRVSASTNDLQPGSAVIVVKWPVWEIVLSILGGLVGGWAAYLTPFPAGPTGWRILFGAVTGPFLYWAVLFGLAEWRVPWHYAINLASCFMISFAGGYAGTEVLTGGVAGLRFLFGKGKPAGKSSEPTEPNAQKPSDKK